MSDALSVPREEVIAFVLSLDTSLPDAPWPEAQAGDIVDALAHRYGWNITPRMCGTVGPNGFVCGSPDAHEREDTHYTFAGSEVRAWRF
jgi:hypothetical protein